MKKIMLILLSVVLFTGISHGKEPRREKRKAREKLKTEEIRLLVENRDLQFQAQMAHPMGGGSFCLTSEYTLEIVKDSITSYLPYFGVAYYVEYGSTEGGIKFSGKAENIKWEKTKKGYDIVAEVRSPKDTYLLHLFVSTSGFADLNVSSRNRQNIRFSGIVYKRD